MISHSSSAFRATAFAWAIVLAAGLSLGGPTAAQELAQQQPPAANEFTESDLRAFAEASLKVDELSQVWQPRITAADTQEKAQNLRREAMNQMVEAVRESGLEVMEYNRILQLAQSDPETARRVEGYREELKD